MPIDVSILRQQVPMQMPSLMESRARANQLLAADAQLAANALQLQRAQREEQQAQDINKLYSLPGAVSPTGELDYGVIGQAAPGMGLARLLPELNKQRLAEMKARGEAGKASYEQAKARDEAINQRLKMYQEKYRFVTTPEAALAMHNQVHADPILQPFFNELGVDAAQGLARIEEAIANGTFPQFLQEQSSSLEQVRDQRYVQALNRDVDEAVKPPTTTSVVGEREGVRTSEVQAPRVNVLGGPDGQIVRIQLMADQAQREGRLDIAQKLLAQAKTMQDALLAGQPEDYRLFKLEQMDAAFKARRTELAKLRQQSVSVSLPPSQKAEQTKRGEKFADDYVEWTSGGKARSEMGLSTMGNVIRDLKAGKPLSGPIIGLVPDALLAFTSTGAASVKAREDIERIVQADLRATLGAQVTEKEGSAFLKRVFNPSLSGPQLVDRLERLYRQMDVARQQRDAMAEHFEANETLRGYKGPRPSLVDFQSSIFGGGKSDKGAGAAATPQQGVVTIKGQADFDKLPSGAQFKGPDGVVGVKP